MTNATKKEFLVKCPRCGLSTVYSSENKFRPFCSERCKILDLGAWAEGSYAIPVQEMNYDEMAFDEAAEESPSADAINSKILEKLKSEKK